MAVSVLDALNAFSRPNPAILRDAEPPTPLACPLETPTPVASPSTATEIALDADTLRNYLPAFEPGSSAVPVLVFHHRPGDGRASIDPGHQQRVLSFLVLLRGIWKSVPPRDSPEAEPTPAPDVCLILIDESRLANAMAMAIPFCTRDLAAMQPWERACDFLNYFALVPPVSIFDPSRTPFRSLCVQKAAAPPPSSPTPSSRSRTARDARVDDGIRALIAAVRDSEDPRPVREVSPSSTGPGADDREKEPKKKGKNERDDSGDEERAGDLKLIHVHPDVARGAKKRRRSAMSKEERRESLASILGDCKPFDPATAGDDASGAYYRRNPNTEEPPRETDLEFFRRIVDADLLRVRSMDPSAEATLGKVYRLVKDEGRLLPLWTGKGRNPKQSVASALSRVFSLAHGLKHSPIFARPLAHAIAPTATIDATDKEE